MERPLRQIEHRRQYRGLTSSREYHVWIRSTAEYRGCLRASKVCAELVVLQFSSGSSSGSSRPSELRRDPGATGCRPSVLCSDTGVALFGLWTTRHPIISKCPYVFFTSEIITCVPRFRDYKVQPVAHEHIVIAQASDWKLGASLRHLHRP